MKISFKAALLGIVFLAMQSSYVYAQSAEDVPAPAAPQATSGKTPKTTTYDFSEVDILGKFKSPEGKTIVDTPDLTFKRLLDLDESFVPNIIRSVDDF